MRISFNSLIVAAVFAALLPNSTNLFAVDAANSPTGENRQVSASVGISASCAPVAAEAESISQASHTESVVSEGTVTTAVAIVETGKVEPEPSTAERISRLEASVEADQKRFEDLNAALNSPENEYAKAEASFRELDAQRTANKQKQAELEQVDKPIELSRVKAEAEGIETKWTLAKERFDLAIGERKAMQESVGTLQRKLEGDRASLSKLKDAAEPKRLEAPAGAAPNPITPPAVTPPPATFAPPPAAAQPIAPPPSQPPAPTQMTLTPAAPAIDPAPTTAAATPAERTPILTKKIAKELAIASEVAQKSQAEAKVAEDIERTITERIDILQQDIKLQRQLRDTARKTVDNLEKTLSNLNTELFRNLMAGQGIEEIRKQIEEVNSRLSENRAKSREISSRLDELQSQLAHLQADQLAAAGDLAQKLQEVKNAQAVVESLRNPFTVRNLMQWGIDHGPKIASIIIALGLFVWLSRLCEARLVELTAKRGRRGSREERENRAKTLLGVFRNVANIVLIAGGGIMILDEIGVPVAPIIGGATVFGLAVAFGAQSLIKDYFVGFMILLEQQYLVNDVIGIGETKGQVERVSLRTTVLRDLEGRVHFIPHSQITTVTNLTHGWSRAVLEIGVAYKENVDRVIQVLTELADELRYDEQYKLLILSDPVMLGVDSFSESAVIIKFYIQTRPLQQWTVKREMLRRIKNEFDRLGIEIPFPHLTIYRSSGRVETQPAEGRHEQPWRNRDAA